MFRTVVPVLQSERLLLPIIGTGDRHHNLERFKFILGLGVAGPPENHVGNFPLNPGF
jgi:hypothetical protein